MSQQTTMKQGQVQEQTQKLGQKLRLSQLQMLHVQLLEMSINELGQKIETELVENPALEKDYDSSDEIHFDQNDSSTSDSSDNEDYEQTKEREDKQDELDKALQNMEGDDEVGDSDSNGGYYNEGASELIAENEVTFYDSLKEQMGELSLTPEEQEVMEYIIGSLDDDGRFRKDMSDMADELAIYHYINVTSEDIERVLKMVQTFDPPGIGARDLRECLMIQIERKENSLMKSAMRETLKYHYEAFEKLRWDKIQAALEFTDFQMETLKEEFKKLNPTPGSSLNERIKNGNEGITPDFTIHTDEDQNVTFTINTANMPTLVIESGFKAEAEEMEKRKDKLNKSEKEAYNFSRDYINKANLFIEAIRQRHHTMTITMKAIIKWQRKYFISGDEEDLRPMILKDIADKTGLDISTVSRVCNQKYAQTDWGVFRLRHFFSDGYTTEDGTEISVKRMKVALKDIIDKEDKKRPLSDEVLAKEMKAQGYPVARRTVTKYRESMNIPVARFRKK